MPGNTSPHLLQNIPENIETVSYQQSHGTNKNNDPAQILAA